MAIIDEFLAKRKPEIAFESLSAEDVESIDKQAKFENSPPKVLMMSDDNVS